jgi:DNA modification methylase
MDLSYAEFLAGKAELAPMAGFDIDPDEVHPLLLPHQRDAVCWAVRRGRAALFEAYGLGKTLQQLEIVRLILSRTGGRGLIVCPLGVRQEFVHDAKMIDLTVSFIRDISDAADDGIYLTNYETIRDGRLDPRGFQVVSLDEAAVLRGFGGTKTFREMMRLYEGSAAYRFVATATPSPNEYIELLSYAAFLDILDVGQGKTRFFKRDSEHADRLTLLPHMEERFWLWCSSWALFLERPSQLGHPDDGYDLPPLDISWLQLPSPPEPTFDRDGRGVLFERSAMGVQQAAAEKRRSIPARVAAAVELIAQHPTDQWVVWCDLNDEQRAIEAALKAAGISVSSLYGNQPLEIRESLLDDWREKRTIVFLSKPSMYGAGVNLQQAHRMIFTGIGFRFFEFAQSVHRIHRFLQAEPCAVHIIYTDNEHEIRRNLERKWRQHDDLVARMGQIIERYGLSAEAMSGALRRSIGVERQVVSGAAFTCVLNDTVAETASMDTDQVDLIVTSIPFSTQYEYSPSYNDFGHNADNAAFWSQMDYLTPQLLRVLKPGRIAAVHVKDRVIPGGMSGLGFQTIYPFSDDTIRHFTSHGFAFLARRTIVTDVVRENNQTYRLGWTEQCKDGTKMGAGLPEYLLLFRKPPTDNSDGYADQPVVKEKAAYSRSRWQVDAHGYWRSNGNRHLLPEEFDGLTHAEMFRLFRDHNLANIYDYESHVAVGEHLEAKRLLPTSFMLLQPPSGHPDVWTDVARMRTLNMVQERKGWQMHLAPLQFDIVDRVITQHSMPGETVFDPFGGIMTVPYCALKLGRRGIGVELNPDYWRDGVKHCEAAERDQSMPTLFDLAQDGAA